MFDILFSVTKTFGGIEWLLVYFVCIAILGMLIGFVKGLTSPIFYPFKDPSFDMRQYNETVWYLTTIISTVSIVKDYGGVFENINFFLALPWIFCVAMFAGMVVSLINMYLVEYSTIFGNRVRKYF
jgi:hypothetical protein